MVEPTANGPRGGSGRGSGHPIVSDAAQERPSLVDAVRAKADAYEALTGLAFRVRLGKQTAFDHNTDPGTVILGVEQLSLLGIDSQREVDFICLHELGHFQELAHDPTGYRKIIDEANRSDGLGPSFFRFYNALLDVYVNRNTLNRAPTYGDGRGGFSEEIKDLYTLKLFQARDLTGLPKSTQYSYALLNIGMGVGADLAVSSEVREALDKPFTLLRKPFTTREIIETFLVPAIGILYTTGWKATVSERKSVIDKTFRKRFESLVELDKKENRDPNQGSASGDLEGMEPTVRDLDKATKAAEKAQKEANKSAQERAADQQEKSVYEAARKYLDEEEARDLAETHRKVFPLILQVSEVLREIVRDEVTHRKMREGLYSSGQHLDVASAVDQFHAIQANPTQARVFEREVYGEVVTEHPQHVRIWTVFDLSGSMEGDIQLVRELSVIFAGAVQTLSLGAELEQHSLRGSFGAIGYNDDAFEILPMNDRLTYGDIARSYGRLNANGNTYEAPALNMVAHQLSSFERDENVVDIVTAITDGETIRDSESQAAVKRLEQLGAKLLAFQFGRVHKVPDVKRTRGNSSGRDGVASQKLEPPSGGFARIWGQHGYKVRKAEQVVPAVRDGLRELLKK